MKKNYFAPKALIVDALCNEYCAEETLSTGANIDAAAGGFIGGNVDDLLGDEE